MNKIKELVFDLPEQYQIIYGYPEFDNNPSRACVDRAELLIDLVKKLIEHYQRPIKVLDLGCAQGYFCFRLAELGCEVVGVDFLDKNIAVCSELAMQNANLKCKFEIGDVVDKIEIIQAGDFDLVYSFSVLHHVCHFRGKDFVQQKLVELSHKCGVFLYEAALKSEPLYWAPSLPEDAYELVQHFDFYRELQQFGTHLSDIVRPLYFCSNKFLYLSGELAAFDCVSYKAHEQHDAAHKDTRRYYYTNNKFFKVYYFKGLHAQENLKQIQNEIEIYSSGKLNQLSNYIPIFLRGELFNDLGYVSTSKISGEIVSKLQSVGNFKLEDSFIHDLMTFLVALEEVNLFYNDLRTWNMMLDNDGKLKIIDVASIQSLKNDFGWPRDLFISFILLMYELYHGSLLREDILRQFRISPVWFNDSTDKFMQKLWSIPYNQWSFKLIQELNLKDYSKNEGFVINPLNIYLWMGVVEEFTYCSTGYTNLSESIQANKLEITRLHVECMNRNVELDRLHCDCVLKDVELDRLHGDCVLKDVELDRLHGDCVLKDAELDSLHADCAIKDAELDSLHGDRVIKDAEIDRLHIECVIRDTEINRLHSEVHLRNLEIERLNFQVRSIYATFSWKITKPIRFSKRVILWFYRGVISWVAFRPESRPRRVLRKIILLVISFLDEHSKLKRCAKRFLSYFPSVEAKIKKITFFQKSSMPPREILISDLCDYDLLSPKAKEYYDYIKNRIDEGK